MRANPTPIHTGRKLQVAVGRTRLNSRVKNELFTWTEFVDRLREPIRTNESHAEYKALPKADADSIKDVGYFIGGHSNNGFRKKNDIPERDIISLDGDHGPVDFLDQIKATIGACAYAAYSTHSHRPDKPRLRILVPLKRAITAEEYAPIVRKLAEKIDIEYFDGTTDEVSRAMFWPSVSTDGEYLFEVNEADWVDPDEILAEYADWRDVEEWPMSSHHKNAPRIPGSKAPDPRKKPGLIGAFCRAHDIHDAILEFIPESYEATTGGRYTHTGSTTTNGAVTYSNTWLYSHHEKDPCSGRSVNAFDLVRLHKFGELDDDIGRDTPTHELPSYRAMVSFAEADEETKSALMQEALLDFEDTDLKGIKDPITHFLKRYVYIEKGDRVCDLKKPTQNSVLQFSEFKNSTANVRHEIPNPTIADPGRVKLAPVHAAWLVHPSRKTAHGEAYEPDQVKRLFQDDYDLWWVNSFHMPVFDKPMGDTAIFHEHMAFLIPIEAEREWFIDWMAFNLQNPGKRCKVTPLHISTAHGIGRGWVVELMHKLLGPWNCSKVKMNTLCGEGNGGGFQDYLNKSLFCAVEEVREGKKRYEIADNIRDILTEDRLEVNIKFGAKKTQPVFTNFFFMSNHTDALVLKDEDRRINVFRGPDAPKSDAYYRRLYAWLENGGAASIRPELMARNLSKFNWTRSIHNAARTTMIGNTRTETETLFHEFFADPPYPAMTYSQIENALLQLSEDDIMHTTVDRGQLTKLLQHHAEQVGRFMIGGREGKAVRPWVLDPKIANDTAAIKKAVESCGV